MRITAIHHGDLSPHEMRRVVRGLPQSVFRQVADIVTERMAGLQRGSGEDVLRRRIYALGRDAFAELHEVVEDRLVGEWEHNLTHTRTQHTVLVRNPGRE